MWTIPEMLHWTIRKNLGHRLYYFVRMDMAYHVFSGKIAKARNEGYKITQVFWPSSSHVQVRLSMKRDRVKGLHSQRSTIWIYVNLHYSVHIFWGSVFIFLGVQIFCMKRKGFIKYKKGLVCLCVCSLYLHHFYQYFLCFRGIT